MICKACANQADLDKYGEVSLKPESGATQITLGHGACKGCDCRHFPPGTLQPFKEDE